MVDQGLLETNLLQLFAHPESSEWFSIISVIIFEVKIVTEQKEAQLVTIFFVVLYVSIALNFFAAPPLALPLLLRPVSHSAQPKSFAFYISKVWNLSSEKTSKSFFSRKTAKRVNDNKCSQWLLLSK